jgi:hypothetical protein
MYNSHEFEINESRVISSRWDMDRVVVGIWKSCNDYTALVSFMTHLHGGNYGSYERELDFDRFGHYFANIGQSHYSETWKQYVMNHKFVAWEHLEMFENDEKLGRLPLKFEMIKDLLNNFPEMDVLGITSETVNYDSFASVVKKVPQAIIDKVIDAIAMLKKTDYNDRMSDPEIEYVKFNKNTVLGRAHEGKIQLSIKLMDYDVTEIARIIIEENEHLITEFGDETREFQDHLFKLYFNQLIK